MVSCCCAESAKLLEIALSMSRPMSPISLEPSAMLTRPFVNAPEIASDVATIFFSRLPQTSCWFSSSLVSLARPVARSILPERFISSSKARAGAPIIPARRPAPVNRASFLISLIRLRNSFCLPSSSVCAVSKASLVFSASLAS